MPRTGSPEVVLIVEQNATVALLLAECVTQLWPSVTVFVFDTLRAALAWLRTATPDLLVLALTLPDIPGDAPLRGVQGVLPFLTLSTPLLVLSGQLAPLEGIQALRAGATGFLSKEEWHPERILQMLARLWARMQGIDARRTAIAEATSVPTDVALPFPGLLDLSDVT